ncbi:MULTISPECIES: phage antirepressor KilAC domain-containing protein [Fusobacterium]|uniref:phage antirepressor KilAC domain-containing protein n=1 Tax=Fusobacterium TaxID=848 RepID=UPI002A7EFE0A|nr:phage antirepressor KilAC domain-containing protein [Fusobacterium sp.]
MNELKIIDERELLGKQLRIYGDFQNPLFLAKDVAEWIEHSNVTKMLNGIDKTEKIVIKIPSNNLLVGLQSNTEYTFLTEEGLYEVLMQSRKPIAKEFKKKVKEILKDVRKYGMYATDELLDNPDLIIKMATRLKEEKAKNKELEDKMKEDKPKVLFADAVATSQSSILVGDLAKILKQNGIETGQKRLFSKLRDEGYLIKQNGMSYNMPTQKSMELELFEIKETAVTHSDGHISINKTVKVTGKGQQYFINLFLNEKIA